MAKHCQMGIRYKSNIGVGYTPSFPSRNIEADALRAIAVVNLKKSAGKKSSKYEDLKIYVESDFDLLMKQIDLIEPKIIVCASTFGLVKSGLDLDLEKVSDRVYKHNKKGFYFVDFWHPAAIFPHQLTYHSICSLINSSPISREF